MEEELIKWVYLTVLGQISDPYALPGVENAFRSGSLCDRSYGELYDLLLTRFNPDNNDEDDFVMTRILNDMDAIQKDLCFRMFRLGMRFALDSRNA